MSKLLAITNEEKNQINSYMPSDDVFLKLANFFQNFSDVTRLKIIVCLSIKPLCVNDISNLLSLNQTTVSHQMQILKSQDLVAFERKGKMIFYSLKHFQINDLMLGAINKVVC